MDSKEARQLKLEDLGYSEFFASSFDPLMSDGVSVGRVIAEHKGAYSVINERGIFFAKITGKQMFTALGRKDFPAVGDWVAISETGPGKAVIQKVLPRKTVISRNSGDRNKTGNKTNIQVIGANIDAAFVVESVDRDYNLNRLERYFVLIKDAGISPAVVLNKTDLISPEELEIKLSEIKKRFTGAEVIPTSTMNSNGLDKLNAYILPGKTYCFLGSSGVGKSSLINKLIGKDLIKTGKVSAYSGRGQHVTTSREMYFLESGGIVIDNPGIREVGLAEVSADLGSFFEEIAALATGCKYNDCTHVHEPGCAVLAALETDKLDRGKYNNYISLKKEVSHYGMTEPEKREKDRKFGKFFKNAKKDFKKYGYKNYL